MAGNRFRHFGVIFYGSQKELFQILHTYHERIAHYAFILHDKDVYLEERKDSEGNVVNAVGDLEKEHFHVIVDLYNAASANAVKRLFTTPEDTPRVEVLNDIVASYRYLTHKDNPEKYQYPSDSVISDDIHYYESLTIKGQKRDSDNMAMQIIEDLLKGLNPRLLVDRYGRDFAIHMKQYQDCADAIRIWEMDNRMRQVAEKFTLREVDIQEEIPFD